MVKNKPVKDGKIRSFNLSVDAIAKMERGAEREGVSRSAYIERLIITNDHTTRVKKDIDRGVQTTLDDVPTPPKPRVPKNLRCLKCPSPLHTHLRFEDGEWTAECPNVEAKA
jgi:hypothetical protein